MREVGAAHGRDRHRAPPLSRVAFRALRQWVPAGFGSALVTVLVAIPLAAGCGDSIVGADPDTGLRVEVRKGPIEPVERPGRENTAPVEGARVRIHGARGGSLQARTGTDGTVRLRLVPGRYRLEAVSCPGTLALPAPVQATVHAGEVAEVRLECDTGIR